MPLTITLQSSGPNKADVIVDGTTIASFEPQLLRPEELPEAPLATGRELWAALGGARLREHIKRLPCAPDPESLVAIRTADPELSAIPWEYLHTGEDFLVVTHLLVREVPGVPLPPAPNPDQPWRLVAQGSDPLLSETRDKEGKLTGHYTKLPRVQTVRDIDALRGQLLSISPPLPIRWQHIAPTPEALTGLSTNEPILFHYTGRCAVVGGQPVLCLDDGAGRLAPQPVRELTRVLHGQVYAAVLNLHFDAESDQPVTDLALSMARSAIPAVLAMYENLPEQVATTFATTFYEQLGRQKSPAEAVYEARKLLCEQYPDDPAVWGIPSLFVAAGHKWPAQRRAGEVFKPIDGPALDLRALQAPAVLLGREEELVDVAMLFRDHGRPIVTIRGPGGIGKTALAEALAQGLRFHFTDGIYALTIEHTGEQPSLSAAAVRRQVAELLGIQHHTAFEDPVAYEAQEQALAAAVQGRNLLLIFDNYETVLWRLGRDEDDRGVPSVEPAQHAQAEGIQRLLTRLARAGANMLFTSLQSGVVLPGETLYPGQGRGRSLGGLSPESAAALFRLKGAARAFTRSFPGRVAETLSYSPLAIELAASRWGISRESEAEFLHSLSQGMRKVRLDGIPDQHVPVIANIRLTIDSLDEELRRNFLDLLVVANPVLKPIHGAVIWRMVDDSGDEPVYLVDQAHGRLEDLRNLGLLQGSGYDEHGQARSYRIQSVVAQVMRQMADEVELSNGYVRYARWAESVIDQACGANGIDYNEPLAREIQDLLPDIPAGLPYLPSAKAGWSAVKAASIFRRFTRPVEAMQLLELAEETIRETNDRKLLAHVRHIEGEQKAQVGQAERALELYREALGLAEELNDQQQRAQTLFAMANVAVAREDLNGAMRLYQQAHDIQEQIGDLAGKSATLYRLGNLQVTYGDPGKAVRSYQLALDIQERLGDLKSKSAILHGMANLLASRGDPDKAMRLYQHALDIQEQIGDMRGKGSTLYEMAKVFATRSDPESAMRLFQHALFIQEQLGDLHGKGATLHEMGKVIVARGDMEGAMRLYQRALEVKEQLGDTRSKPATLQSMAQIWMSRGDHEQALQLYQQSLEIAQPLSDLRATTVALHGIAQVRRARGELEQACRLFEQSLDIEEQLGDVHGKATTLYQLAQIELERGERAKSLEYARDSLLLFELLKDTRTITHVQNFLTQVETGVASAEFPVIGGPIEVEPSFDLASTLLAATLAALRDGTSAELVRTELAADPGNATLDPFVAALREALERQPRAASRVLVATEPLLVFSQPLERADAYVGIANLAVELHDAETELAAQEAAVAAQREAGDDQETLVHLSVMLYNLAALYTKQRQHTIAVDLLEEVVALDERTGSSELENDRAALEAARLRAHGAPGPSLHNQILDWCLGTRTEETLTPLLILVCNVTVAAMRDADPTAREALAESFQPIRDAAPLPMEGADAFLEALQVRLRNDPEADSRVEELRTTLPPHLADTLDAVEQMVTAGKA